MRRLRAWPSLGRLRRRAHRAPHIPQELVATLRAQVAGLAPLPESPDEDGASWHRRRKEMRELLLHADPREFLTWQPILDTMNVGNAAFVAPEFEELRAGPAWDHRWAPLLLEDQIGSPAPWGGDRRLSGTLIHHAYHLMSFERATGSSLEARSSAVEFGGGYGSLARLLLSLGFRGRLHVHDFPEFLALQRFFLAAVRATRSDLGSFDAGGVSFGSSLEVAPTEPDLFIALWSLSETPPPVRTTWAPVLAAASHFLIGYQESFEGTDNVAWFEDFLASRPDVRWTHTANPHIPGHWYLFGTPQ